MPTTRPTSPVIPTSPATGTAQAPATRVVTAAGHVEGVLEPDGACTHRVGCGGVVAQLLYSSATSAGTSPVSQVVIP